MSNDCFILPPLPLRSFSSIDFACYVWQNFHLSHFQPLTLQRYTVCASLPRRSYRSVMGFVYILSAGTTLLSAERKAIFPFPSGLAIFPLASKSRLALSPAQWVQIRGDYRVKAKYSQCKADHWVRLVATKQWNACWVNGMELGKHYLMNQGKQNTTSSWKSDMDFSSTLILWGTWCFLWAMT